MRILVTGGAGFIGSHLVDASAKENDVIVFDDFSSGKKEFLKGLDVRIIHGDIRNLESIKRRVKKLK